MELKTSSMYLFHRRGCRFWVARKEVSSVSMKRFASVGAIGVPIAVPRTCL